MKNHGPIRLSRCRLARQGLAGLLAGLFLFVQVLVVSSPLHGFFHQDATAASHVCVVTLLSHGHLLPAVCSIQILPQTFFEVASQVVPRPPDVTSDFKLLPSRAPPPEGLS